MFIRRFSLRYLKVGKVVIDGARVGSTELIRLRSSPGFSPWLQFFVLL